MDCSPPGSSVRLHCKGLSSGEWQQAGLSDGGVGGGGERDSPGKNTGVGCHFLLQGIFPTQRSNLCLMSPALAGGFFTTSALPFFFLPFSILFSPVVMNKM